MLNIIYEDDDMIACCKPAGIAVQSASFGKKDLESMVRTYIAEKSGKPNPYLGVVHRLDQPVQGIVVMAKTKKAAASLSAQVQDGGMEKEYLAVICGKAGKKEGELVDFLLKDGKSNSSKKVAEGTREAKKAVLSYRVVAEKEAYSLMRIKLQTGRHHQIRVQMASAGLPLYGDTKYNPGAQKGQGLALCADHLTFVHPGSGEKTELSCRPVGNGFEIFT
ncbi:MAG: RluA family pseudouridine synthase [Eubacteriales bacterium]|nr:RluA family pseudouridine synthase [Eubacteriales bacterium]